MGRPEITFEDLVGLAQESRNPCGKQAFSKRGAGDAARDRNRFITDKTYYAVVCFDGCGKEIFHLTTQRQSGRMRKMFEEKAAPRTEAAKARKRRSKRKRRRSAALRPEICVWEGEGGSYAE